MSEETVSAMLFDLDQLSAVPKTELPFEEVDVPEFSVGKPYSRITCNAAVTTIERVARAIWDADRLGGDMDTWRSAAEGHREDYRNMARGAILALNTGGVQ